MDFFGIGAGEILLIIIIALIIWGPNKLPGIARTLGKTVQAFKKATSDLTTTVTREIEAEERQHLPSPPSPPQQNSQPPKPPTSETKHE